MEIISIIFFISLAAFFSCSEMVLLALSKFEIKKIIKDNKYKKLIIWLKNPGWFITGIIAGNTIAIIGFGSAFTFFALKRLEGFGINSGLANTIVFILASFFILVLGEILPKNIGRSKAHKLILYIYKPFLFFMYLLSPVIFLFHLFEKYILRRTKKDNTQFTRDDLHKFVKLIEKEGVIKETSEDMIHSYLDLRTRKVKEVMVPISKIEAIDINEEQDFFEKAIELGRSRIPVYRGDIQNIVGLLYAKDMAGVIFSDEIDIKKFLRTPIFVNSNDTLKDVFKLFKKNRKHLALVRDNNLIIGLITLEDVLEEIIGEITDEYDLKRKK